MEAEQLVSSTGAGVVLLVVTVLRAVLCLYERGPYFFKTIYQFSSKSNEQQLRLATYRPLVEFLRECSGYCDWMLII